MKCVDLVVLPNLNEVRGVCGVLSCVCLGAFVCVFEKTIKTFSTNLDAGFFGRRVGYFLSLKLYKSSSC